MFHHLLTLSALVASIIIQASAHTWIEEYQVIGPNGSYIGDRGFSRGYIGREDPDFDGSFNSLWLLPQSDAVMPDGTVRLRINSTDTVCRNSQQTLNYTNPAYPMLKAAPGDYVAMKYLENGHVTLPWTQAGKPAHGGTVYVFGTTQPIADEMLVDVMQWTTEGTGGNGRGRLLATQNFDDGRCHQINDCTNSVMRQAVWPNTIPGQPGSVSELWCETDVKLPDDLQSGIYTTYWVWQWPTAPCKECEFPEGKDEWYTTCADHQIIAAAQNDEAELANAPATNTLPLEDFTMQAVSTYKERQAFTTHPVILDNWANFNEHVVATTDRKVASFASSCAVSMAAAQSALSAAGFPTSLPPLCPSGKWATGTLAAFYSSKGIASAKSAEAAFKATAQRTTAASATPTAVTPTIQQGGSPDLSATTVQSVYTSWYTSTVTMAPTSGVGAGSPKPSPHRASPHHGPVNHAPPAGGDGGLATVTTEGPPSQHGETIAASALIPGHGISTEATPPIKYVRTTAVAVQGNQAGHIAKHAAKRRHARSFQQ